MPDASRRKLIEAAVGAFGTKGFHGTTTRDIAERAGMSPAAIYVHYRSKEELLDVISRDGHRDLLDAITSAGQACPRPADRLREIVRAWVRVTAENLEVARVVKDDLDVFTPEHRDEIVAMRLALRQTIRDVVAAGAGAGEFSGEATNLTTRAIISLGMDVPRWYHRGGSWTVEEIADHFAAAALRIVRP